MKKHGPKSIASYGRIFFVAAILLTIFVGTARAEGKTSIYAGVLFPLFGPVASGDFNGETYFESETELFLVPKIKAGFGFEGLAGVRLGTESPAFESFSFELVYHRSSHGYSFFEAEAGSTKADFNEFILNARSYLGRRGFIQPLLNLELGVSFLNVKNAAYTYTPPLEVGTAKYSGVNFGLGAGAEIRLPALFALQLRAAYHILIMEDVRGVEGERYKIEKITATFPKLTVGLLFYFRR